MEIHSEREKERDRERQSESRKQKNCIQNNDIVYTNVLRKQFKYKPLQWADKYKCALERSLNEPLILSPKNIPTTNIGPNGLLAPPWFHQHANALWHLHKT